MKGILLLLIKNTATKLLFDVLMALIRRITWQQVLEHLFVRLIKNGLRRLAKLSKNTVDDEIVELVIKQLESHGVESVK